MTVRNNLVPFGAASDRTICIAGDVPLLKWQLSALAMREH